jgi:hypothetical protein
LKNNVTTYWSRCLDPYCGGMEVKAFGEKSNLDTIFNHWGYNCSKITCVLMSLFCQWFFWTSSPRFVRWNIYDENEPNNTVFKLRIVKSICTYSDERYTGVK